MAELRIDLSRQRSFEPIDFFGDLTETLCVAIDVAAALFVGNDGEAFAKSGGKLG